MGDMNMGQGMDQYNQQPKYASE